MRTNKSPLKYDLIRTLTIFIVVVLFFIFVFQSSLISFFYRISKQAEIKNVTDKVSIYMDNGDLESAFNEIDHEISTNEVCVALLSNTVGLRNYSLENNRGCAFNQLSRNQIKNIEEQISKDGDYVGTYVSDVQSGQLLVFGEKASSPIGDIIVLTSTRVNPQSPTIKTMQQMFLFISIIVITSTVVVALVLSRRIIKPIELINEEAKTLPNGKYNSSRIETTIKETSDLNETLENVKDRINQSETFKKELIGNVSHDLKTPLTMIVGYAEMIRDLPGENTEDNLNVIIDEANRLSYLVSDLIDMSKIGSSEYRLNREKVSINMLIVDVYKQYKGYYESKNVGFNLELEDEVEVDVDIKRIKQVIYNLINNAYNYNSKEHKQITIKTALINNAIRVSIIDNGDGIAEKEIPYVFDRYYKVDKEHKRQMMGSGIGLSLCKEILTAHKAKFGVNSKVNEFSEFWFELDITK